MRMSKLNAMRHDKNPADETLGQTRLWSRKRPRQAQLTVNNNSLKVFAIVLEEVSVKCQRQLTVSL